MRRRPSFSSTSVSGISTYNDASISGASSYSPPRQNPSRATSRPELISRVDLSEMLGAADMNDIPTAPLSTISQDIGTPYSPAPSPVTVYSAVSNAGTLNSAMTLPPPAATSPLKSVRRPPPAVPSTAAAVLSSSRDYSANRVQAEKFHADGYKLRREGDFEGAIFEYSRALDADNKHFKALFNRGFAYDKLGERINGPGIW
jgi:tetratricopeptide (TPR) repeat protein